MARGPSRESRVPVSGEWRVAGGDSEWRVVTYVQASDESRVPAVTRSGGLIGIYIKWCVNGSRII